MSRASKQEILAAKLEAPAFRPGSLHTKLSWIMVMAAVAIANQHVDRHDIEIWQGPRVVAYLGPDKEWSNG